MHRHTITPEWTNRPLCAGRWRNSFGRAHTHTRTHASKDGMTLFMGIKCGWWFGPRLKSTNTETAHRMGINTVFGLCFITHKNKFMSSQRSVAFDIEFSDDGTNVFRGRRRNNAEFSHHRRSDATLNDDGGENFDFLFVYFVVVVFVFSLMAGRHDGLDKI